MKTLRFYFDPVSPYAALAFEHLPQALEGCSHVVEYRPVLLAGILHALQHKGPAERLFLCTNDGRGGYAVSTLDSGKENHIGARAVDMDGDGDADIVGFGWDDYQLLHLWRNDRAQQSKLPTQER